MKRIDMNWYKKFIFAKVLNMKQLKKYLKQQGFFYARPGSDHDIWKDQHGRVVPVPRHTGDISSGLFGGIKRQVKEPVRQTEPVLETVMV